ncbi:hypothetical protein [Mangrovicoccus sp. HB161399]|uniref:hypothetical protein n=1 Tax=Mangrovicoccus sp. HB161399 TaxID=2720392 RepID=UPI001554524E|nr:hypothetical protein [Mangrovicoccus sp. HB161399]
MRLYIAETDEHGAVTCVWVQINARCSPVAISANHGSHLAFLPEAEVSGASKDEVAEWLKAARGAAVY